MPNFKHLLPKKAFCVKSDKKIQLPLANCVSLHLVLETGFCQILNISCQNMRFASKSAQKIQLALENCFTTVCVGNWLLPNFKHLFPKKAFCVKSDKKIQLPLAKNRVSLHLELETGFCQILNSSCQNMRFASKSAQKIQLALKNYVSLHYVLETGFCQILSMSCQKMRFVSNLREENNLHIKITFHFVLC